MPAKSKAQQRFMGMVRATQKGEKPMSKAVAKAAKSMDKSDVKDYASTKHKGKPEKVKQETKVRKLIRSMVREIMKEDFAGSYPQEHRKKFDKMRQKQSEVLGYKLTGKSDVKTEIDDATVTEAKKKRDYKAEYKKYGSSKKAKKYRAELNAYNRKKGTYGNGDGKDASHKGGKIVGFEKESVNRGRAEKSRLKKEMKEGGPGSGRPKNGDSEKKLKSMHKGHGHDIEREPETDYEKRLKSMGEGGPGSGPQNGDDDNPFDREPSDDELADIEKQYEGKVNEKFTIRPPAFSSREAKGVVDGALRNYSKDLKKLQYRVVKDWMSKAKSGVIDYFDLVRGFQSGDSSRAYPYEVEFLMNVLTKDKIIDRFRKYFGGKKGKQRR
jgi:hypothetical protein